MMRFKISGLADVTGFAPSTIRYYEKIGLLPEPERTSAGHRVYDEAFVDMLMFVSRAKRLGMSLEETSDLLEFWSEGTCDLARRQLQLLLAAKLEAAGHEIAELTSFRAQLAGAYERLAGHAPSERCRPECGCPPEIREGEVPDAHAAPWIERSRAHLRDPREPWRHDAGS